ncbi:MAG: hypothetical protein ABSH28_03645 [Acidobacteriota bacterium]|jgi:hypothetical protein
MTQVGKMDLIILVADKKMEAAIEGALARKEALGIRSVSCEIERHSEKDCGCRTNGVEFLSIFARQYEHALLIFDYEGCGAEATPIEELESKLRADLGRCGWEDRADVVIINPELEIWVWSDSPWVDEIMGWKGRVPKLRQWLRQKHLDYWPESTVKPSRPKEAFESALREVRKIPSASLFKRLAENVSFNSCTDPAFAKFKTTLQKWFGEE